MGHCRLLSSPRRDRRSWRITLRVLLEVARSCFWIVHVEVVCEDSPTREACLACMPRNVWTRLNWSARSGAQVPPLSVLLPERNMIYFNYSTCVFCNKMFLSSPEFNKLASRYLRWRDTGRKGVACCRRVVLSNINTSFNIRTKASVTIDEV